MQRFPVARIQLAVLCAALLVGSASARPISLEGKDLNGHAQRLSRLRGQIVVLSFWATWCGPCQEELPRLSKLSQSYADKNVRFVAVSIDDPKDRSKIQPFLTNKGVALEVWTGANSDDLARFGLGDIVPGTVVLDQKGELIGRIMGEAQDTDVRSRVDWLLGGRKGVGPDPVAKRY